MKFSFCNVYTVEFQSDLIITSRWPDKKYSMKENTSVRQLIFSDIETFSNSQERKLVVPYMVIDNESRIK